MISNVHSSSVSKTRVCTCTNYVDTLNICRISSSFEQKKKKKIIANGPTETRLSCINHRPLFILRANFLGFQNLSTLVAIFSQLEGSMNFLF